MSLEQTIESEQGGQETWDLRLYIAGTSAKSVTAAQNLRKLCEKYLPGRYTIELVDLMGREWGRWEHEAGTNMLRFQSDEALKTYKELMNRIQQAAEEQTEAQRSLVQ